MNRPPSSSLVLAAAAMLFASVLVPPSSGRADTMLGHDGAIHEPTDDVYLLLRLRERRLYLMRSADDDRPARRLDSFPVAIGRKEFATPTGRFRVTEKIVDPAFLQFDWENPARVTGRIDPGPDNPLGLRWIGFTTAYGWDIGFHGTPRPELLGQAVSHGCVRMRNSDVVKLYGRIDVGTPVIVQP